MQLLLLFLLTLTNSVTFFALSILLAKNIYTLALNVTTIEGWEIDRHDTVVRRARALGGSLDGPDGRRVVIKKQEFPYDVGVWANVQQALGKWPGSWIWPFAATWGSQSGLEFEVNGFEGELVRVSSFSLPFSLSFSIPFSAIQSPALSPKQNPHHPVHLTKRLSIFTYIQLDPALPWPPPDPDRIPRRRRIGNFPPPSRYGDPAPREETLLESAGGDGGDHDYIAAFRQRQAADFARRDLHRHRNNDDHEDEDDQLIRRKPFRQRFGNGSSSSKGNNTAIAGTHGPENHEEHESNGTTPRIKNSIATHSIHSYTSEAHSANEYEDEDSEGEEAWRNSEGEKLGDFGVDEAVEFYDDATTYDMINGTRINR